MSRHSLSRNDRVAQMSVQEEIIARKKLEILEKQKTAELAKQVVAAQAAASKPAKKEKPTPAAGLASMSAEPTVGLPKNSFNNDGSFFENFKKITDAAKKAQQELEAKLNAPAMPIMTTLSQAQQEHVKVAGVDIGSQLEPIVDTSFMTDFHPVAAVLCANPPPPPPPPPAEPAQSTEPIGEPMTSGLDFDGRTEGQRFFDADEAAFEEFEKSRPPPPVVTKPLTQYTSLVPTHSDGCEIPGFGPDTATVLPVDSPADFPTQKQDSTSFADANERATNMETPAPFCPISTLASGDVGGQHFPQQQPSFLQQLVSEPPGSPTPSYVNPFAQNMRPSMNFPPSMDLQHLQHIGQHMPFPPLMNHQFMTRPPPVMNMPQQQQQQHQHFGGPQTPFMPGNAFQQQLPPPQQQQQPPPQQVPPQNMQHPPPQLHTIPPPNSLQLNKIPAPRALDLAAIPEPQFNLEAIKMPDGQLDISRDHEFIPTSVESLTELVAENGDEYEDRLRSRKIDMHSSLWFLCDRSSLAYQQYRKKVLSLRYNTGSDDNGGAAEEDQDERHDYGGKQVNDAAGASRPYEIDATQSFAADQTGDQTTTDDKYDPADMYDEDDDDVDQQQVQGPNDDNVRGPFDQAAQPDYDSDSEYMRETMNRNFGQQLKRKHDIDERQLMPFGQPAGNSMIEDAPTVGGACGGGSSDEDDGVGNASGSADGMSDAQRKKRSRWGDKVHTTAAMGSGKPPQQRQNPFAIGGGGGPSSSSAMAGQTPAMLTHCTRTNPALLAYARQSYGTIELDDETWRKCEDHFKVNLLYQDMLRKRNEIDRLARAGRQKYEYDSDEDVRGGTWEHKARNAEMEATAVWSDALTKQAEGKHHIGDFLPPEELRKFMEKYDSQQTNREPDLSDYREYKLREDNKGFQMLQKLGWKEGQGLGFDGAGIVDPVNKAQQRDTNQGLGTMSSANPEFGDNEYDAYRKRMMLAYRFRPNPLNNPRRSYY